MLSHSIRSFILCAVGVLLMAGAFASEASPRLDAGSTCVILASGGLRLPVSLKSPVFDFDGTAVGGSIPSAVKGDLVHGATLQADYGPTNLGDSSLEVRLFVRWFPREKVLRKWAKYRLSGTDPRLLKEVVLEDLDVSGRHIMLDSSAPQSLPAFLEGFFAGIEFPVASTRLESQRLILAHRPGLKVQPGAWRETRKAVYGIAPRGGEGAAFERYISANRPGPKGLHISYNSWWTSPVPYKESDILGLMRVFRERLYQPHGVCFDTFCIDMGWSNLKDPWEINTSQFPEGFTRIRQAAEQMGSHLGLWISPSSGYPGAVDNSWAGQHGFEVFNNAQGGGACLAGEHYRDRLQKSLVRMVADYGVRQIKFDGYRFECLEADHGHEPGLLSGEAIADGMISVTRAVRKAAPDTWMETTCFGWNPSPWWLFYVSSVIGTYGDDAPFGRVPAPVYRESYTTARDYFNLQGADLLPIPIASTEVLGIIHQTDDDFLNDAVMTIMRGHMFLPAYVNPKYMSDARWKAFADLLGWARRNASLLQETEPLVPKSWQNGKTPRFTDSAAMPREPYGYAHWSKVGGLVALRNPWIEPQTYSLRLGRVPGGAKGWSAVSIYPEARLYATNLRAGQNLGVPLAPYETVVLSFGLPDASGAKGRRISFHADKSFMSRVKFDDSAPAYTPTSTSEVGDADHGVVFSLSGEVTVDAPESELLVLMEGASPQTPPYSWFSINGLGYDLLPNNSDAGWAASGLSRPEHWLFLGAPLPPGTNSILLDVHVGGDACFTFSVWVLAKKPGIRQTGMLPAPETICLDAMPLLRPTETRSLPVAVGAWLRPTTKVLGVYLDALEPVSATQGWGTLRKNMSVWEKPLTIGGKPFRRGLGTHAPSRIVYALDGKYRRFRAWVGADSATAPSVVFEVAVDGQKRWKSPIMTRNDPAERIDIDITGAKTLELIVGDGGNGMDADHADWADAQLIE
jgi:hypothetical protein